MNNPKLNTIADGNVQLSKLFEWFRGDFDKNGGIAAFVGKYLKDDAQRAALKKAVDGGSVKFLEYDWALNKT